MTGTVTSGDGMPALGRPLAAARRMAGADWRAILADHPRLVLGLLILGLLAFVGVFCYQIAPYDPLAPDRTAVMKPPSMQHWFGTDDYGRDVFSRVVVATRSSLVVGSLAVLIGLVFGTAFGMISAFYRGATDTLLMRLMEILFAFPAVLLAIVLMAGLGNDPVNAMIAIGITFIPGFARVARATTQPVADARFVDVARTFGMSDRRILLREILPNIRPIMLTQAAVGLGAAIIVESSLGFLGLGTQPPYPSWGNMVSDGLPLLRMAPWVTVSAGLAIFVTVLGSNLVGDGLRDYLDPRYADSR